LAAFFLSPKSPPLPTAGCGDFFVSFIDFSSERGFFFLSRMRAATVPPCPRQEVLFFFLCLRRRSNHLAAPFLSKEQSKTLRARFAFGPFIRGNDRPFSPPVTPLNWKNRLRHKTRTPFSFFLHDQVPSVEVTSFTGALFPYFLRTCRRIAALLPRKARRPSLPPWSHHFSRLDPYISALFSSLCGGGRRCTGVPAKLTVSRFFQCRSCCELVLFSFVTFPKSRTHRDEWIFFLPPPSPTRWKERPFLGHLSASRS